MKVGIVGAAKRTEVWEKHLRELRSVTEVIIASSASEIEGVTACILLDDSPHNLDLLSETIRLGIHSYLIAELSDDEARLKKIHSLSQESDVRVQFSHWPTISPASQWMKNQLPKPGFIQVIRENSHLSFSENRRQFHRQWMDEIAWIIKWMDMGTHRIEAHDAIPGVEGAGLRVHLKFENGATASLFHLTAGTKERHRRVATGSGLLMDCDVTRQSVKKIEIGESYRLNVESRKFDATRSAGLSAMLFFKAVKLGSQTAFTPYDAIQASGVIRKVRSLLHQR